MQLVRNGVVILTLNMHHVKGLALNFDPRP
jgi:hypothetical protein